MPDRLDYIKRLKDEDGAALVIAMLMMVMLTLLGFTSMLYTSVDLTVAGNEKASLQAQYAAEAGINDGERFLNMSGGYPDVSMGSTSNWSTTIGGTVQADLVEYTYNTHMEFYKSDSGKVVFYNQSSGYPPPAPKKKNSGFPVIVITSTARNPAGHESVIELLVTKYIVPLKNTIKGALTANGNIDPSGSCNVYGYNYDENGTSFTNTTSQGALPAIESRGTVQPPGGGTNVEGAVDGGGDYKSNTGDPPIKSVADALGMTEDDFADFLQPNSKVHIYDDDETGLGLTYPPYEHVADFPAGSLNGDVYYVNLPAGANFDVTFNGNGLVIVHNSLYVPEQWRQSADPGDLTTYKTNMDYYNETLDPSDPNGDGYSAAATDPYKPSVIGNINAGSFFKGVLICDRIDKFNGGSTFIGAVIALDSMVGETSNINGNTTIKYSEAAVDKYAMGGGRINKKISWRKKTAY